MRPQTPPVVSSRATSTGRLHHLDALRAVALLLGIVLHSLLPFVPGMPWLFEDSQKADWTGLPPFLIHLFRMSVFMMLAGYFGRMMLHRRGTGSFVRDRLRRIGLPVLAFWPLAVGTIPVLIIAGVEAGLVPARQAPPPPAGVPEVLLLFAPAHLWFLLLLMELILVTVAARALLVRALGTERAGRWSRTLGSVLSSPIGVLVAAVPYALGVLTQGTAVGGILEPTTIIPVPGASIAYLGAFLTGWFLHARPDAVARVERQWIPLLVLALPLSAAAFLVSGVTADDAGWGALGAAAAVTALAGWTWGYGLVGLFAALASRPSPAVRYLSDASYWIYLLHLPLLLAVGIPLAGLDWPIVVKLAITWSVTLAVLLVSYDLLVRQSWVGAWLNGRRRPRGIVPSRRTSGGDDAGPQVP